MDGEVIRYLYDRNSGGPPRAYECNLDTADYGLNGKVREDICGAVTRTLQGMRSHQRSVHGFKAQLSIPLSGKSESE